MDSNDNFFAEYKNEKYTDLKKYVSYIERDLFLEADSSTIQCPFFPQYKNFLGALSAAREINVLSRTSFDPNNVTHVALLRALYASITLSNYIPDIIGSHWETIGFQSSNPASDLRSTGLLGLLLPTLMFTRAPNIAYEFISAANTPHRDFPMMLILINVVNSCIDLALNRDILKGGQSSKDCIYIISLYFNGVVLCIAREWKKSRSNFVHGFQILEKIPVKCAKNPHQTIGYAVSI